MKGLKGGGGPKARKKKMGIDLGDAKFGQEMRGGAKRNLET